MALNPNVVYCFKGDENLVLSAYPETDDDLVKRKYLKEAEQQLADTQHSQDGYAVANNVVYRFCRSARQFHKLKGDDAKSIKRRIDCILKQSKELDTSSEELAA